MWKKQRGQTSWLLSGARRAFCTKARNISWLPDVTELTKLLLLLKGLNCCWDNRVMAQLKWHYPFSAQPSAIGSYSDLPIEQFITFRFCRNWIKMKITIETFDNNGFEGCWGSKQLQLDEKVMLSCFHDGSFLATEELKEKHKSMWK